MARNVARIKQEAAERGPTPETRSKLRADQVIHLYSHGVIDERQMTAALEIREVFDALSAMHLRGNTAIQVQGGKRTFHPLDGLSPEVRDKLDRNYRPWRSWADREKRFGHRVTEITIKVVADSNAVPGQLKGALIESLERYADIMEGLT